MATLIPAGASAWTSESQAGVSIWGFGYVALGVLWCVSGQLRRLKPTETAWALGSLALLAGPQVLAFNAQDWSDGEGGPYLLPGLMVSLGLLVLGVRLGRGIPLGLGATGVVVFVPQILYWLFGDAMGSARRGAGFAQQANEWLTTAKSCYLYRMRFINREAQMSQSSLITVLNPEGRLIQTVDGTAVMPSLAKRLDTLEGKTIYLVDTGFGGSFKFMRELENWFASNMPAVKTVRTRKPGGPFADDNDTLWEEIKQRGDAAILGVGG